MNRAEEAPSSSTSLLSEKYKALWMNRVTRDIARTVKLGSDDLQSWMKKDARVVIVYSFVNRKDRGKPDYSIIERVNQTL